MLKQVGRHSFKPNLSAGSASVHLTVRRTAYSFTNVAGPVATQYFAGIFDPSGTVTSAAILGAGAASQVLPGWASLATVFDEYKLNYSILTARLASITGGAATVVLPATGVTLRSRFNYDPSATINAQYFSSLPDVTEFVFTPENPIFTYKVYPKIYELALSGAVFSSGTYMVPFPWADTDSPLPGIGLSLQLQNLPTGYAIFFDVSHCCSFRSLNPA